MEEKDVVFFLTYQDKECTLQLSEYDTVELLKIEVHRRFEIPPHKQKIIGWKNIPENDNTILQMCSEIDNITFLTIVEYNEQCFEMSSDVEDKEMESEASISFINKVLHHSGDLPVNFCTCRLKDAISEVCLAPLEERRALMLYLHNQNDGFFSVFWKNLINPEVVAIINRSFFLMGWDIEDSKYHNALTEVLNDLGLSNLVHLVNNKIGSALCIVPIGQSVTVYSCIKADISDKDFVLTLKATVSFLTEENQEEQNLRALEDKAGNKFDITSKSYLQLMADRLGDRDYDSFEFDEHNYLKEKIAFSLIGPPKTEEGYEEKQNVQVEELYQQILRNNNEIAKDKDRIEISFIYNCIEPLPSEKVARAKKYKDYNPNTDLMPLPIFVIRKCRGSDNPCRIFIDHTGRTYNNWKEYLTENKLHACRMVVPRNGRFEVDENEQVLVEYHLSPACSIDSKILQGADYASTAGGLISGGIFIAAAIPAVTVAPAALIAGGIVGLGVGIYAVGRSIHTLIDRSKHNETISFANSEARGAYLNIVAGSLGFVGAGANVAVSQLVQRGVNIGTGARAVVNTIGVVNIGASGISIVNSGYDVFDQWYNENQTPSLLTIMQLSSSILFFGNAVYNFRMCSTIIEETQTRVLQDYQDSLRSNRHRKTFSKLMKETVKQNNGNEAQGRAEVINAIRNIQNKDEVFAVLTRTNKNMNKNGIKFAASGGEIQLNGISINMNEFASMNKRDANIFLSNLPSNSNITASDTTSMRTVICNTLTNITMPNIETLTNYAVKLLSCHSTVVKQIIVEALEFLLSKLTRPLLVTLDELFPNNYMYLKLMKMIVDFFATQAQQLADQYKHWRNTNDATYYNSLFEYIDPDKAKRYMQFFEKAVTGCYNVTHFTEAAAKELIRYFYNWLAVEISDYNERTERTDRRRTHSARSPTKKVCCEVCGGYYYTPA